MEEQRNLPGQHLFLLANHNKKWVIKVLRGTVHVHPHSGHLRGRAEGSKANHVRTQTHTDTGVHTHTHTDRHIYATLAQENTTHFEAKENLNF